MGGGEKPPTRYSRIFFLLVSAPKKTTPAQRTHPCLATSAEVIREDSTCSGTGRELDRPAQLEDHPRTDGLGYVVNNYGEYSKSPKDNWGCGTPKPNGRTS